MSGWKSRIVGHGEEAPDQLLANPENWRIHPKAQQDALAGVLGDVGWVQSVIVNRITGHLVDGHLRVSLALRENEPTIPVAYVELTPDEERLVLATIDPIAGLAHTDKAKLEELLAEVSSSSEEVEAMLREMGKTVTANAEEKPVEVPDDPITKSGDIWTIGSHRIGCGDSFDDDFASRIPLRQIDAILTDPPYGIALNTDYQGPYFGGRNYRPVVGDNAPFNASKLRKRYHSVKEQFWFGAEGYRRTLSDNDLDGSWIVWDKRWTDVEEKQKSIDKIVTSSFELLWTASKHKHAILRHLWSAFDSRVNDGHKRQHPTEKPVALLIDIIDRWIDAGATILDPFAGSGTTLIAAAKTGRIGYGIEIDPGYVDVIVKRLEQVTGETATRESA